MKPVPFRLALLTLGCAEDDMPAAGRLVGMEGKTVGRALAGGIVSETLIANAMAAFRLNADRLTSVGLTVSTDEFFDFRPAEQLVSAAVA